MHFKLGYDGIYTLCGRCGVALSGGYPDKDGMCWTCFDLVQEALAAREPPLKRHKPECLSLPLPFRVPVVCNCEEIRLKEGKAP